MSKKPKSQNPAVKSAALIKGEFTVPEDAQESLRALDMAGADIQKQYGAFMMDVEARKNQYLAAYQKNREEFQKTVEAVAKDEGVDFSKIQEKWSFDLKSMTFRRVQAPSQTP